MQTATYLIGRHRTLFNLRIQLVVFAHFGREVLAGRLPARGFFGFLDRLRYFLSKMRENKYVTASGTTKINLYVPGYPSPAFFKACAKVATIGVKQPCISVLLSVTSACRFRCAHCYQRFDRGKDMPIELLTDVVRRLDAMGVAFFNIEGGDPFLAYDRLHAVCAAVTNGEIWVNSTGEGITDERLTALRGLGMKGVMFSLHAPDEETVNRFMGRDSAWSTMLRGMECCRAVGVDIAVNSCLLRPAYSDGTFERLMDLARELGVTIIQLIKPKPSGAWLDTELDPFTEDDLAHVTRLVHDYNNAPQFRTYPFIAAQIIDERADMFGCTAGGTDRFYINAKGDVQPCEFLNISFGNLRDEDFDSIYNRMRKTFDIPGSRWLCETCAHDIHALRDFSGSDTLPLDPSLSMQIHAHWNRGEPGDFYRYADVRFRTPGS